MLWTSLGAVGPVRVISKKKNLRARNFCKETSAFHQIHAGRRGRCCRRPCRARIWCRCLCLCLFSAQCGHSERQYPDAPFPVALRGCCCKHHKRAKGVDVSALSCVLCGQRLHIFVCASAHLELSSLDAIASHSCAQCAPIRSLAIKLTHTCTHCALQRVLNREMEQTREKGTRCAPQHLRTSPQRSSHREQFTHALEFRQTMHGWRTWLPCVVRPGGSRQSRR